MTREEIIEAIQHDNMMPFLQDWEVRDVVDFVLKNIQPSLPEGLDEAAEKSAALYYADGGYSPFPNIETAAHKAGFKAGAEYQRKQDQQLIELAEDHAMLAGMNKMKENMMEKAFRCEIIKSRTHMPHLKPYFFSSDYGKVGDKVRVFVIPEEK